ncbi:hypothetical protein [Microbacterium sp. 77mftsu3.1]|uniref:hypothetical protein n=1 Tax=Microbacterium sp. 77mftsu3.1 TaxID=1761802 RepID=UPI00037AC5D7|nr:hypothetical protein [Microbacterium sp. 77mftsu3.1]SDH39058.1 hypothetical protein SAMN04488590_3212 [Microbacterium sp. 77mftsu3.1]
MGLAGRFCYAPAPQAVDIGKCVLDFPHPGQDHRTSRGRTWEHGGHGAEGDIIDVAFDMGGNELLHRVAITLMVAFGRAEPGSDISKYPVSVVATFADMARSVLAEYRVEDRLPVTHIPSPDACAICGEGYRLHGTAHEFTEPSAQQQDERRRSRRRQNQERAALSA